MVTWGLGIEHEFFLKFDKKKMIGNNYYDLYINSNLVKNLSFMNEINFYQKYKSYIKNDSYYNDYKNLMEDLIIVRNYAINKKKYPFEKKSFYNILYNNNLNNKFYLCNHTITKIQIYYYYFILHHDPFLFFHLKFDDNDINTFELFDNMLMKESNNKEELVKFNYDLLTNIFEKNDPLKAKEKISNLLFTEYELIKISSSSPIHSTVLVPCSKVQTPSYRLFIKNSGSNIFYLKKKKGGNIKNEKDLQNILNNQIKKIKNYLFNDIKINKKIIKDIFFCYKNDIPELDISSKNYMLEMKTINYKNLNYEDTYKELINYESVFIEYIQTIIHQYVKNYGNVIYDKIGSRKESIELTDIFNQISNDYNFRALDNEDYTGSYHIWVTCPYDEKISKVKFLNMHAQLANKLQLLEPLIACNFSSPSFDIKYNKNYPSKLSLRHFINAFSNYGTSDISLINGSEYTNINNVIFKKEDNPTIERIHKQRKKVYNTNNTLIKNYNALNNRKYTNNVFDFITHKKNNSKNVNVTSFYELLFKNNKLSFKQFKQVFKRDDEYDLGADIRTRDNDYMMYPNDKSMKKVYYPKNNKYILYYLDNYGKLHDKRKYDKDEYNKYLKDDRMGIEFRIFDHFNSVFLDQILCILPYLIMECYDNQNIKDINDTFISKQFWHNEMYNVIVKGYKHNFSKNYVERLNKEFNINMKHKKYSSDLLLEELYNSLKNKYSRLRKYKNLLNKLKFNSNVNFISLNEYATKLIEQNF